MRFKELQSYPPNSLFQAGHHPHPKLNDERMDECAQAHDSIKEERVLMPLPWSSVLFGFHWEAFVESPESRALLHLSTFVGEKLIRVRSYPPEKFWKSFHDKLFLQLIVVRIDIRRILS